MESQDASKDEARHKHSYSIEPQVQGIEYTALCHTTPHYTTLHHTTLHHTTPNYTTPQ